MPFFSHNQIRGLSAYVHTRLPFQLRFNAEASSTLPYVWLILRRPHMSQHELSASALELPLISGSWTSDSH